jgi:RNA recognition motif-containing protein
VEMEPEAAAKAIEALDGTDFEGHILRVNEARDRGARPPRRSW